MEKVEIPGYEGYCKIDLDETFKFHCTKCGKCCINRHDIILNPYDIFRAAKTLNITIKDFVKTYCTLHTGNQSRLPVVCLYPKEDTNECPLLENNKCMIHESKPVVCAMFPLGRMIAYNANGKNTNEKSVSYIFSDPECGDNSETHTVREWLDSFDIEENDRFFLLWSEEISKIGESVRVIEKYLPNTEFRQMQVILADLFYGRYDVSAEFMNQFTKNIEMLHGLIDPMVEMINQAKKK